MLHALHDPSPARDRTRARRRLSGFAALVAEIASGLPPMRTASAADRPVPGRFALAIRARLAAGERPARVAAEFDLSDAMLANLALGVRPVPQMPRTPAAPERRAA